MSTARQVVKAASRQRDDILAEHALAGLAAKGQAASRQASIVSLDSLGRGYVCGIVSALHVAQPERIEVMDLLEENMRAMYEASSMGWSRREKQGELFDRSARFLIVRDSHGVLAAFVNWRFDCEECDANDAAARQDDDAVEVAYCYEMQVQRAHQSQRLGAVLMGLLESIAARSQMRKVMLTVFVANTAARRFYHRVGYESDLISPLRDEAAQSRSDYDIMSKTVLMVPV